jgi:hypothetical protein
MSSFRSFSIVLFELLEAGEHIPVIPASLLDLAQDGENRGGQEDVGLKLVLHDLAGDDPARPRFRSSCDHCI